MRARYTFLRVLCGLSTWLGLAVQAAAVIEPEALSATLRYRGGVHNAFGKQALPPKQLHSLLNSLRAHTGWQQLYFDENGFLTCPDESQFVGGSAAARQLLSASLDAPMAFDLENHQNARNVAFGRLAVPVHFRSMASGRHINVYPIQLDFADFVALRGESQAVAAFDVGLVLLHELAHGVWSLKDTAGTADELGQCEKYVNQIRRELNLPERQHYAARSRDSSLISATGVVRFAELRFTRKSSNKETHYYLQWDIIRVGWTRETAS